MRSVFFVVFLFSQVACAQFHYFSVTSKTAIPQAEVLAAISASDVVVFGETHSFVSERHDAVQTAIAELIRKSSNLGGRKTPADFGWEFLTAADQVAMDKDLVAAQWNSAIFVKKYAGQRTSESYGRILDEVKGVNGSIWGLSLPQAELKKAIRNGVSALAPEHLPEKTFPMPEAYRLRFEETMNQMLEQHGGGTFKVENLTAVQWLKDEKFAETFLKSRKHSKGFILCGSFHSDFQEGVIASLKNRDPQLKILSIRVAPKDQIITWKALADGNGQPLAHIVVATK